MAYNLPSSLRWAIQDRLSSNEEERKRREEEARFLRDIEERKMAEAEANGAITRKAENTRRGNEAEDRYSKSVGDLERNSDAFEMTAGRMDPALFAAKYGGGGDGEGSKGRGRGGGDGRATDPAQDYMSQIIAAYKEAPEGMEGEKEDFMTFADRYQNQFPQQAPALDPFEMRRKRNSMDINSPITKDFQDNMRFSAGPDGLRFTDRGGPVAGTIKEAAAINQIPRARQPIAAPASIRPQFQKPTSFSSRAMTPQSIQPAAPVRQPITLNTPIVDIIAGLSDRVKKKRDAGMQKLRTGIYGNR